MPGMNHWLHTSMNAYQPYSSWILRAYVMNILQRLPEILANCASLFGSIVKIGSTKKICWKLPGRAAGSASWCIEVGNEWDEVLTSRVGGVEWSLYNGSWTNSQVAFKYLSIPYCLAYRYEKAKQNSPHSNT